MVWILLLVHITLHGMIGGLLKHFPKAVCGIIFICKNTFECQKKRMLFFCLFVFCLCFFFCLFIAVSVHLSQSRTHRAQVQFKSRGRDIFWRVTARRAACFLSLALIRKCCQHGLAFPHSRKV